MLNHKISLIYGDPSSDGHGISSTDYYMCSHTSKQIAAAMRKAESTNSFNFSDEVCAGYEEANLSIEQIILFDSMGVPVREYLDIPVDDSPVSEIDEDERYVTDFTGLYLAIAKTQLPDLEWKYIADDSESIDIGGYGMLSNG